MSVGEAEPQLDNTTLPWLERPQHIVDLVLQIGLQRRGGRGFCVLVFDQVAELGIAILADRGLERHRVARGLTQRLDLVGRESELLGNLLVGRLPAQRITEPVGHPDQLVRLVADVDGKPDRAGLVADGA